MLSENNGTISREEIGLWCKKHDHRPAHMILCRTPIVPEYYSVESCFKTPHYNINKLIVALKTHKPRSNSKSSDFRVKLISYLESINQEQPNTL